MRIELFGTMRVFVGSESLPKMRSRKAKWLLALLVLRRGNQISRASLADLLWPDVPRTTALTNLRSVASDLRKALGTQASRLRTPDRQSLEFDFQNVEADVLAFDAAIKAQNDEIATTLYTGPLLQDCDEEWARSERTIREQNYLSALHRLIDSVEPPEAITLCQRAIRLAPWQEGPRRDLMTAYVRSGNQNAALVVYRDFAQRLRAETGRTTDTQTTDLYIQIRSGSPSYERSEPNIQASLPHAFSSFIGREDERVELVQEIRTHRLVTLTGIGGIGKTRLAREVAQSIRQECSGGAGFVALEAVGSEATLVQTVVAALQIKLKPKVQPFKGLVEALRNKRFLLVLDNCEHLVSACAKLVNQLLTECPEVRVLATSREPLCLIGEVVWPLVGLTTPDPHHLPNQPATRLRVLMGYESVRLFVERAQKAAKGFDLTRANSFAVAELCALLEGSPLAIELAAGRVRTMAVEDILEQFRHHRLDFLIGHQHTGAPRHQTLRAALDWSFLLLEEEERQLFVRLAVFADGWTMEAAVEVVGASPSLLESLVEKSLVVFSTAGRYGFLETVRQYADERLAAIGEVADLRKRHVDYFAELAESLAAAQVNNDVYEREMGNFNAVMDRADSDPDQVLYLLRALYWYWLETYAVAEGARRIEEALARSGTGPSALRAQAFRSLALFRSHVDRLEAVALHEESFRIWKELNDQTGMLRALSSLGLDAMFLGDTRRALTLIQESIQLARQNLAVPHVAGMLAYGLNSMALVCLQTGDYARSRELISEGLELMRKNARPVDVAIVLRTKSFLEHDFNDYATYRSLNEEALSIYRAKGNLQGAAWCLIDLGIAATELGQTALGKDLFEEALATTSKLGDSHGMTWATECLGNNAVARGEVESGLNLLKESLSEYRIQGYCYGIARTLDCLGDASRIIEDPDANTYYREALVIWQNMEARKRIRDGLIRIGDGLADLNQSIRLWASAHQLGEKIRAPIPLILHDRHENAVRMARAEPQFETVWTTGKEMSHATALELAIKP